MKLRDPQELQRLYLLGFRDQRARRASTSPNRLDPAYRCGAEAALPITGSTAITEEQACAGFARLLSAELPEVTP
jgi:hypothetical protein